MLVFQLNYYRLIAQWGKFVQKIFSLFFLNKYNSGDI